MKEQLLLCHEIKYLYHDCKNNNKKIVLYKNMGLDCKTIYSLFNLCFNQYQD